MRLRLAVLVLLASYALGCTSGAGAPADDRCDPFVPPDPEIGPLTAVIAVGRDPETGTLYVVEGSGSSYPRFFVSAGGVLRRRLARVRRYPDRVYLTSADERGFLALKVELAGGAASGIGITRDPSLPDGFDLETQGERLDLVEADAVTALPARDVVTQVLVMHDAKTDDGRRVVLMGYSGPSQETLLFYGRPERMIARAITDRRIGPDSVSFTADGAPLMVFFPPQSSNEDAYLQMPDGTRNRLVSPGTNEPVERLGYVCP